MERYRLDFFGTSILGMMIARGVFFVGACMAWAAVSVIQKSWIFFGFSLFFAVVFALVCFLKIRGEYPYLLAEITVDAEKITVIFPNGEDKCYKWIDFTESGIYQTRHQSRFHIRVSDESCFICLSRVPMKDDDKRIFDVAANENMLCVRYTAEILLAIRKYYPLSDKIRDF